MTPSPWIYHHNLSRWIFQLHLGGHTIGFGWYGLAYVLGFALAYGAFREASRSGRVKNLSPEALETLLWAVVAGVLVGGRLGYVAQHPARLLADPMFAVRTWEGGMAFFGGLLGVIVALWWVGRKYHIGFWQLTDVATFPAALGLGIGRIANFINGELFGKATGGNWGVVFPEGGSAPRHPSQLYESVSHFLLLAILIFMARVLARSGKGRDGVLSAVFLIGYGLMRFVTDFWRDDDMSFGPFSAGQWASLLVALLGFSLLYFRGLKKATAGHNMTVS